MGQDPDQDLHDAIARLKRKAWNQKSELRKLNRAILFYINHANQVSTRARLQDEMRVRQIEGLKGEGKDYRGVCKCWTCRLREWYRFRMRETYPLDPGDRHPKYGTWRFPGSFWPHWR